jgi:hypothetical protein
MAVLMVLLDARSRVGVGADLLHLEFRLISATPMSLLVSVLPRKAARRTSPDPGSPPLQDAPPP